MAPYSVGLSAAAAVLFSSLAKKLAEPGTALAVSVPVEVEWKVELSDHWRLDQPCLVDCHPTDLGMAAHPGHNSRLAPLT